MFQNWIVIGNWIAGEEEAPISPRRHSVRGRSASSLWWKFTYISYFFLSFFFFLSFLGRVLCKTSLMAWLLGIFPGRIFGKKQVTVKRSFELTVLTCTRIEGSILFLIICQWRWFSITQKLVEDDYYGPGNEANRCQKRRQPRCDAVRHCHGITLSRLVKD